jgi:hypothetical protein
VKRKLELRREKKDNGDTEMKGWGDNEEKVRKKESQGKAHHESQKAISGFLYKMPTPKHQLCSVIIQMHTVGGR